jgi:lysyl-tRNA synthetase class I
LDSSQRLSLTKFSRWLNSVEELTEENLKNAMIQIQNEMQINAKSLFQAIYLVLIGRQVGPRLGPFMTLLDLKWIRMRFASFAE